jgi:hypothetical protein
MGDLIERDFRNPNELFKCQRLGCYTAIRTWKKSSTDARYHRYVPTVCACQRLWKEFNEHGKSHSQQMRLRSN